MGFRGDEILPSYMEIVGETITPPPQTNGWLQALKGGVLNVNFVDDVITGLRSGY